MLEWTGNPCVQGCTYCYAKMWKRENEPIEKLINFILKKEREKEGMIPFLLRKRSPITISNRSDILCAPDWRERLSAIKALGFPIYLETKLNKDWRDLAQVLDKEKDTIYQTVTGWNNKYEESNILSAEEKIEAAKWLNEQGFYRKLSVNPYLPDKTSMEDIIRMIELSSLTRRSCGTTISRQAAWRRNTAWTSTAVMLCGTALTRSAPTAAKTR